MLSQYYQNHVTQPLILEDLRDRGLDISAGEIHAMLTEGHDAFHAEKDALLPAAREVSSVFHTDDTSARHQGQNAHTHQIGNEAALIGCLIHRDLYPGATLVSDDAGQFQVLGFMNCLCWIHAVRHADELVPETQSQRRAHETTLTAIWKYYRRLKAYRESPSPQRRAGLERDFASLFGSKTGWPELNTVMERILRKRESLLLVLDHPEIPLTNNLSERDIREYAKKRKISAGTRNDLGRRCRDTFLSLKKTCRKLGVSYCRFLQDRIQGLKLILPLPDLIRQAAQTADTS